jgi:hypothetical protein
MTRDTSKFLADFDVSHVMGKYAIIKSKLSIHRLGCIRQMCLGRYMGVGRMECMHFKGVGVGAAVAAAAVVLQGQGMFGPSHHHLSRGPLHGLQPQSIDGYILQGSSAHGHGQGGGLGFSGVLSFGNVSKFGGGGSSNDPYLALRCRVRRQQLIGPD